MTKSTFLFSFFLFFCLIPFSNANDGKPGKENILLPQNTDEVKLYKTYEYFKKQELTLAVVKKMFPILFLKFENCEERFNANFSETLNKIEYHVKLKQAEHFAEYETKIINKIQIQLQKQIMDNDFVQDLIHSVNQAADGIIESPYLETLLIHKYTENPEQEYLSGFYQTINTKKYPGSCDFILSLKIPISWTKDAGNNPIYGLRFSSQNQLGQENTSLKVAEIPESLGLKLDSKSIDLLLSQSLSKNLLPESARLQHSRNRMMNNRSGLELVYKTAVKVTDSYLNMQTVQYITFYNGKMIVLQSTVTAQLDKDPSLNFQRFLPVFDLMAESLFCIE